MIMIIIKIKISTCFGQGNHSGHNSYEWASRIKQASLGPIRWDGRGTVGYVKEVSMIRGRARTQASSICDRVTTFFRLFPFNFCPFLPTRLSWSMSQHISSQNKPIERKEG